MRWALLALVLHVPDPVLDLGAVRDVDGSVTLYWTLPPDPSVVGITVERERLDHYDWDVFEIVGLPGAFTDTTARWDRSYRYWVSTRDAAGHLSPAFSVAVWSDDDHHHVRYHCTSSAASGPAGPPAAFLGAALAALVLLRGRARP